jgi:hypothetical protein
MTRQLIRYNAIRRADLLDDQLMPADIAAREAAAVTQEDLQEGVLSQIKRIVLGETGGDWFSQVPTAGSLTSLSSRVQGIEGLKRLRRVQVVTAVAVPSAQSFKVLTAAGGETPSRPIAISGTTEGAVVAKLGPGELGAPSILAVSGKPEKNLCVIREAGTDNRIFTDALKATLVTGSEPANNAIRWTADGASTKGNDISVELQDPGAPSQTLSVGVTGKAILVSLATDSGSSITSTASEVISAVNGHATASGLVDAANEGTSTGAGVVTPVAQQFLEGGDFGQEVFGLLQVESTAVDGGSFDDVVDGNRAQLSFVFRDPVTGVLLVASASDVGGRSIEYAFTDRIAMTALPEEAFVAEPLFADQGAAVDVTRQNAYLGGNILQVSVAEGDWKTVLADGSEAVFLDPSQSRKILAVRALGTGDEVELNAEVLDINNTQPGDFQQGISVDTADGRINLGVDTGKVDRPVGDLEVEASAGSLTLDGAGGELNLSDSRVSAPLALSDPSNTALPGGAASILGGIALAATKGGVDLTVGIREHMGAAVPPGSNVPGGGFFDFTATGVVFFDESTPSGRNVFVFMNGVLLRSGDALTPNDVRLGTAPSQGDMIFTFPVKSGDVFLAMSLIQ